MTDIVEPVTSPAAQAAPKPRNDMQRGRLKAALGRQPVSATVDLGASKVACFIMKAGGINHEARTLTAAGVG